MEVFVQHKGVEGFDVHDAETVRELEDRVCAHEVFSLRADTFSLRLGDVLLDKDLTLAATGISNGDTVVVEVSVRDLAVEMLREHNIEGRIEAQRTLRDLCARTEMSTKERDILHWILQANDIAYPLHTAAHERGYAVTKQIIEFGVDINARVAYGDTALLCAVRSQDVNITKLLLSYDAEITVQPSATPCVQATALYVAAQLQNTEIVEMLLEAYEDGRHNAVPGEVAWVRLCGKTALMNAAGTGDANTMLLARFYANHGLDANARCKEGHSAATLCAAHNRYPALLLLLQHCNADVSSRDPNGKSLLHWASFHGNQNVVDFLLAAGAS